MIQSNELRLGNWLLPNHDLDGDYSQVSSLEVCYEGGKHYVVNGYKGGFFYSPIPLTPEILEKAGFVVYDKSDDQYTIYGNHHDDSDFFLEFDWRHRGIGYTPMIKSDEFETIGKPITSLHQLQNLYFALTGEELPIEL